MLDERNAIEAALDCRWAEAIELNSKIIKIEPESVDALNRIAHAYFELGNIKIAKKYYSQVLKFDSYNPIALKNLKIIQAFKGNGHASPSNGVKLSASLFLQEPGKTKAVSLLKVAEPQKLSQVSAGCTASLITKNRGITVIDSRGGYLGVLPDDISFSLTRLMRGGNKYEVVIKSVRVNGLSILIKETFRASKFKNQPSFLEFSDSNFSEASLTVTSDQPEESLTEEEN